MPKERTYTNTGYIETQWAKDGELVCVVSATVQKNPDGSVTTTDVMHQFTAKDFKQLTRLIAGLKRARRDAGLRPGRTVPDLAVAPRIEPSDPAAVSRAIVGAAKVNRV